MSIPITEIVVRRYRVDFDTLKGPGGGNFMSGPPLVITNRARTSQGRAVADDL